MDNENQILGDQLESERLEGARLQKEMDRGNQLNREADQQMVKGATEVENGHISQRETGLEI